MPGVSIVPPIGAEPVERELDEPAAWRAPADGEPGLASGPPPLTTRPRVPIAWDRLSLPVVTLFAVSLSVVLLLQAFAMTSGTRDDLLIANTLGTPQRRTLVASLSWGPLFLLVALSSSLAALRGRAVPLWERAGEILAPLIPICLLPALFSFKFSHHNQLNYLIVLAVFAVTFEPLLRRSFQSLSELPRYRDLVDEMHFVHRLPLPSSRVFFFCLVVVASAGYAAYTGFFTIRNHHRLGTTAFDLGIYDNLMYNALHGRLFHSPVLFGPTGGNYLAGHAEFGMLLFLPFYAIHPGAETMLIIQSVVLGFAAVPLYLFASTRLSRPVAAAIAIAYLMFAPLHGPNFYDFHWIPLAVFFHAWLYYAIANNKHWLTAAMIVVLFAIREDVAVGLAMLGLFLMFSGLRPRLGLILAIASVVWFVIVRFVIMPLAGGWYFQAFYAGLFADGVQTFGSVIKTIVTNPLYTFGTLGSEAKLTYLGHMFAPLALLPCRRVRLLPLAAAGMFFTILTTGYSPTIQISFQYTTHWIPYLFLASVLALVITSGEPNGMLARRATMITLAVTMLAHSYNFGAVLQRTYFVGGFSRIEFDMSDADRKRYRGLQELLAMIPRKASVAATEQETAHVSTRKTIYPLRWPPGAVDYILVGRSHIGDLSRAPLNAAMANPTEYGLLAERDDELYLFKRGHVSPATRTARAKLGLP